MWLSPRTDGYQPPLPLGSKMVGLGIGRVVKSRHPDFRDGDRVRAFGQWADYALVTPETSGLVRIDEDIDDIRQHFGVLGMNGWTAYAGIIEVGKAAAGETVLVSAAAGATGLLACQIAKIIGCRVIGLAGGPGKCRYLVEEIGIDRAIDYKAGGVGEQLADEQGGINVYFDNVAGPLLDDVLPNMAHYGRVALCGLLAGYGEDNPMSGPRSFDQILMRRLTIEGFFSPDFADRGPEFIARLKQWYEAGQITMPFDQSAGLESCVAAYGKIFRGSNIGKVVVDI